MAELSKALYLFSKTLLSLTTIYDQENLLIRRASIRIGTIFEMTKRPFAEPLEQRVHLMDDIVIDSVPILPLIPLEIGVIFLFSL